MELLDLAITMTSKKDKLRIYPIGDVHIGAYNFADKKFKAYVERIAADPEGFWFGGGDILDAVILQDQKRFNPDNLPEWMLSGSSKQIRTNIKDILKAQLDYMSELLEPIKHKCIGVLEGNHEFAIAHHHNRDIMADIANRLDTVNLSDCAFIRLAFRDNNKHRAAIRIFTAHGNGGGRTAGAEPNHLMRLAQDKDCEIVFRGHSHTYNIAPPIPRLTIPLDGKMPDTASTHTIRAANWGAWVLSYATGPSTYDSRANYPVRPLCTVVAEILPFKEVKGTFVPQVTLQEVVL